MDPRRSDRQIQYLLTKQYQYKNSLHKLVQSIVQGVPFEGLKNEISK